MVPGSETSLSCQYSLIGPSLEKDHAAAATYRRAPLGRLSIPAPISSRTNSPKNSTALQQRLGDLALAWREELLSEVLEHLAHILAGLDGILRRLAPRRPGHAHHHLHHRFCNVQQPQLLLAKRRLPFTAHQRQHCTTPLDRRDEKAQLLTQSQAVVVEVDVVVIPKAPRRQGRILKNPSGCSKAQPR